MGLKDTYSADELASLAPEERAALEADAGDETGLIAELAGGADTLEGGADTVAGAAGADTAAGAAGADAAKGAEGADTAPAAEAEATPQGPSTLVYRAQVGDVAAEIASQKEAIKAARAERREALKKMNDGEIDADEYATLEDAAEAKIDAANDKILELNRAATRVEVSAELTQQQQASAWKGMLNEYVADAKKGGIDFATDEAKRGEFNTLLKAFAQEAAAKGMSDDDNMAASRWALEQAKEIINVRHGKKPATATTTTTTTTDTKTPAAALNGLTTLAKMPAAAAAPVADDIMAKIGTLEGEELELYIAKLPPDVAAKVFAGAR